MRMLEMESGLAKCNKANTQYTVHSCLSSANFGNHSTSVSLYPVSPWLPRRTLQACELYLSQP